VKQPARNGFSRRGFTLIELLVAIALIAITFLITVRFSRSFGAESSLAAAAEEVATSIELARGEAVLRGRHVFFEYDLGERDGAQQRYRSICEPAPGREKEAEEEEFLLTVRDWRPLPAGVCIDSIVLGDTDPIERGPVRVAIRPDGSMPSHLIRLTCLEPGARRDTSWGWACVQVSGLLGQARVLNRFVEPEFLREDTFE
jgi:prepilin-type N-terminal cleavage/methylation domain-containing protein